MRLTMTIEVCKRYTVALRYIDLNAMPKDHTNNQATSNPGKEAEAKLNYLPVRLDPEHYADNERNISGQIKSSNMLRLQQTVIRMPATAHLDLHFSRGAYNYPMIKGKILHSLDLRCERCLGDLTISVDRNVEIMLKPEAERLPEQAEGSIEDEAESEQSVEYYDYDGKTLVLAELVEEELMLALPLIPKHKDISLCDQDMIAWLAANDVPEQKRPNPFAILKR